LSNYNNPFGFSAIGRDGGGPLAAAQYAKAAAHTQALFVGDIVSKAAVSVSADSFGVPVAGLPVPGCTSLQNGTPGVTLWLGSNINYGAPAANTLQFVFDTPDTIYIGQGNDNTALTEAAAAGKNANFVTGTGNAITCKSTMSFASGAVATTAGLDLRILRLHNRVGNAEGAYAVCEVLILKSAKAQGSAGV
jgi:hypothetical protein